MILKNKIITLLFLTCALNTANIILAMDRDQQKKVLNAKKQSLAEQQKELAVQKAAQEKREELDKQEAAEAERKKELAEQKAFDQKLKDQKTEMDQAKQQEAYNNFKKEKEQKQKEEARKDASDDNTAKIQHEQLKQAQAATETAQNKNRLGYNVVETGLNNLTDGLGKGLADAFSGSVVEAVKHELNLLYNLYRPTTIDLYNEIGAAVDIIQKGTNNIEQNLQKQITLIYSSPNKNPEYIENAVRELKKEAYRGYQELTQLEHESRRRLIDLYNHRNPQFKGSTKDLGPNVFEAPETTVPPKSSSSQPETSNTKDNRASNGTFKKIATFLISAPILFADSVAHNLSIKSRIDQLITHYEPLNKSWIKDNKQNISRFAVLFGTVAALGLIYKSYSWYYNPDRILAGETLIQLQEQKEQIAKQFAKEIQKPTLSKEEKEKLYHAYNSYMDELENEINEQKLLAGHGQSKKLLFGAAGVVSAALLIASLDIRGIMASLEAHIKASSEINKTQTASTNTKTIKPATTPETPKNNSVVKNTAQEIIAPSIKKDDAPSSVHIPHNTTPPSSEKNDNKNSSENNSTPSKKNSTKDDEKTVIEYTVNRPKRFL